jgi:hypothetical protein
MYYFFFYLFITISVISAMIAVFSESKSLSSVTVFVISFSGIMALINAGYITYVLIFAALLNYSINKIIGHQEPDGVILPGYNNIIFLIITSIFGAILASITGVTIWQGRVLLDSDITLSGLLSNISFEYFIFFLIIFSSVPLLLSFINTNNGN